MKKIIGRLLRFQDVLVAYTVHLQILRSNFRPCVNVFLAMTPSNYKKKRKRNTHGVLEFSFFFFCVKSNFLIFLDVTFPIYHKIELS